MQPNANKGGSIDHQSNTTLAYYDTSLAMFDVNVKQQPKMNIKKNKKKVWKVLLWYDPILTGTLILLSIIFHFMVTILQYSILSILGLTLLFTLCTCFCYINLLSFYVKISNHKIPSNFQLCLFVFYFVLFHG